MKRRQHFSVRGGTDRYELVRRKVERGKQHTNAVAAAVRSFLDSRPYIIATRRDPETRRLTYLAARVEPPPDALSEIAGDALHNLRSALDHLACEIVRAAGNTPTADTAFPIYDDAGKYGAHARSRMRGMSPDAVKAIDALMPYKDGNDGLWRLHRLDIEDKHRGWLVIGSRYNSVNIGPVLARTFSEGLSEATQGDPALADLAESSRAALENMALWLKPAARLEPLKPGDELFTDAPDAPEDPKLQFAFDVAIHQPGVADGEPLITMLQQMADLVGHVAYTLSPLLR